MAFRARELYYAVRIGNFATRPLRQLEADFRSMGASSDLASKRIAALQLEQTKLAAKRAGFVQQAMVGGADAKTTQARIRDARALGEQIAVVNTELARENALLAQQRLERRGTAVSALTDLARTMQYTSAAVVLGFGVMAHSAATFNTEVAQAATQVGNNFTQMRTATDRITKGILEQMRQFPASAKDMADASYDIFSSLTLAGNQAKQTATGLRILRTANMAAVAGQTSLADATNGIVVMLNVFGRATKNSAVDVSQLNKFLNLAFATVRFGRITFSEFTQILGTAAPAAKAANQSFAEMSGTLAFLTRRLPVRSAGVAYARLLEVLQRSATGLKNTGINVRDAAGQMRPLDQIIGQIVKKNPDLVKGKRFVTDYFKAITKGAGAGTIGTIQARRAFVFLVQQFQQYRKILNQVNSSQNQFAESYRIMRQTAGIRWQVFINQLHAMAIEIGATLIPVFEKLARPVQRLLEWFNNLDRGTKERIATMLAWGAAITLVVSTIGVILGSIARLIIAMQTLSAIGVFSEGGVFAGLVAAAPEIAIVVAAIAGLIALWMKYPHVVGPAVRQTFNFAKALVQVEFHQFLDQIANFMQSVRNAANLVRRLTNWMMRLAGHKNVDLVITISVKFAKGAYDKLRRAYDFVKGLPGAGAAASALGGLVLGGAEGLPLIGPGVQAAELLLRGRGGGRVAPPHDPSRLAHGVLVGQEYRAQVKRRKEAIAQQVAHNKTVQDYIRQLIKADRYARAHPRDYAAQLRLQRLQSQISKKFSSDEVSAINAVVSADNKATKQKIKNAKAVSDTLDEAVQKYDELRQANETAYGDITQGPLVQNMMEVGVMPKFRDFIGDITSMNKKFELWRKELSRGREILPKKLIEQIQAAGPDSELFLAGLLRLSPKQRSQYVTAWKRGQQDIKRATEIDFRGQLLDWRKHGRNAAHAFVHGVQDERGWVQKQLKNVFGITDATPRGSRRGGTRHPQTTHNTVNHNNNSIHVHQGHEDLSTTLRKAKYAQKQRQRQRTGMH